MRVSYPVSITIQPPLAERNRLTAAFRLILALPPAGVPDPRLVVDRVRRLAADSDRPAVSRGAVQVRRRRATVADPRRSVHAADDGRLSAVFVYLIDASTILGVRRTIGNLEF